MSVFMGGLVQFVCGYFELMNKNQIGSIICTGYGSYNIINGVFNLSPFTGDVSHMFRGAYFFVWMFFAMTVFFMTCRGPSIVAAVQGAAVVINFLMCAVGTWLENDTLLHAAGYEGFVVAILAIYQSMTYSLLNAYNRSILPVLYHEDYKNLRWR